MAQVSAVMIVESDTNSKYCYVGKTATLKAIKALLGDKSRLQRGKVSAEALLKLSSLSSFPVPVDDISSAVKSEEIAVTFFNAAGHTTVANGAVMLSSNTSFIESDRYIVDKITVSKQLFLFM